MNRKISRMFSPGMSVYFIVMAGLCLIGWFALPRPLAVIETVAVAGALIYCLIHWKQQRRVMTQYLQDASFSVDSVSDESMQLPLPAMILNLSDGGIMWSNDAFVQLCGAQETLFEELLSDYAPEMPTAWITEGKHQCPEPVVMGGKRFRVYGDQIRTQKDNAPYAAAMLYWVDLTELLDLKDEFDLSRPVVATILVDNYDELTSNLPDRAVSNLAARLDDAITSWASGGGIIRRLERNRYLFLFEQRDLPQYIDEKFSILDRVREITNDLGSPATLTIGVGKDGQTMQENYDFANLAVEMSLSRGGDQAVIKDRYNFSFYGGRSQEAERRTKVKSRVMAGSIAELITKSPNVFIMGHRNADLDAVGAAAGVMAICRKLNVPAKIIIDLENNSARTLLEKLVPLGAYAGRFITGEKALQEASEESLLVVVDTNRPDQVESRAFLDSCQKVAVIDHHRRAADYINNAKFNFHEPYASSASELVTELVQNLLEREDFLPEETMALLAGIVLDTKNFTVRTGTRTFEAAAWLRKNGADTVAVKLLFQMDLNATLSRYEILRHAELYRGDIALCCLDHSADRIIAAQAADELLNISGIQTSFVFYPDNDQVICSARSIGEANVQMILEPLGGGGNQATAGAQIRGLSPEEVKEALKRSIDEFFSE